VVLGIATAFSCLGGAEAFGGAWPMEPGRTQAIVKYERTTADQGYDPDANLVAIDGRRDETLSVFVEHGLTPRLTLQVKGGVTRGNDRWISYSGRGPIEAGIRWTAQRGPRSSLAVYLGAGEAGVGRNAGYAAPGKGGVDLEARVLYGRSALWRGREVFVDVEAARLKRHGLADETRLDATLGLRPAKPWLALAQVYSGQADREGLDARWIKSEISIVRAFGDWSVQAGWRDTISGRETARDRGVVLALWRRF
jgi:protein XagA